MRKLITSRSRPICGQPFYFRRYFCNIRRNKKSCQKMKHTNSNREDLSEGGSGRNSAHPKNRNISQQSKHMNKSQHITATRASTSKCSVHFFHNERQLIRDQLLATSATPRPSGAENRFDQCSMHSEIIPKMSGSRKCLIECAIPLARSSFIEQSCG
jgi:hypothetical protein